MSGGYGAGFSQGYGQTLAALYPAMLRHQQEAKQLQMQEEEAKARRKLNELTTKKFEMAADAAQKLQQSLMERIVSGGTPDPMGEATMGGTEGYKNFPGLSDTQRSLAGIFAGLGTEEGLKAAGGVIGKEEAFKTGKPGDAILGTKGDVRGYIPYQPGQSPKDMQANTADILGRLGLGRQGAPGAPAQGASPGGLQLESVTVDEKGGLTVKAGPTQFQIKEVTMEVAPGQYQMGVLAIDPQNPANRQFMPMGQPMPPAQVQTIEMAVQSVVPRESPYFNIAVREYARALSAQGADTQNAALAQWEQKYRNVGAVGGPGVSIGDATKTAEAKAASKAESEARMKERVKREEQPLQGEDRRRFEAVRSVERGADTVLSTFRPEFVGKGFNAFSGQLKKDFEAQGKAAAQGRYVPGAIAASFREFTGNISPEEVTFRRSLLDITDQLLRARSGAAITENEYGRLAGMIGQVWDEPNVFLPSLKRFRDETRKLGDDILEIGSTGAKDLRDKRQKQTTPPPGFRPERR